jgi:hypothetical protein
MARKLTGLQRALVGLEVFLILGALAGAGGLMATPDGSSMGWTTEQLAGTPFEDYFIPALLLFFANALFPTLVIVATIRRRTWAQWGHILVGVILTGWISVQLVMIGYQALIQAIFGALGLVFVLLGALARRPV